MKNPSRTKSLGNVWNVSWRVWLKHETTTSICLSPLEKIYSSSSDRFPLKSKGKNISDSKQMEGKNYKAWSCESTRGETFSTAPPLTGRTKMHVMLLLRQRLYYPPNQKIGFCFPFVAIGGSKSWNLESVSFVSTSRSVF